jgi:hypothetical protein
MKRFSTPNWIAAAVLIAAAVYGEPAWAAPAPQSASAGLPRLLRFSGAVGDAGGNVRDGVAALTFTLYEDPQGGPPLWSETQTVPLGNRGQYSVLLGSASGGLPQDLFTGNQARWVGVQPGWPGAAELPRAPLVGVPYAMKASDAETLGGKPASAYVTADLLHDLIGADRPQAAPQPAAAIVSDFHAADTQPATGTGKKNYIPIWTSATAQGDSTLYQSGSGATAKIGVGTIAPAATLDVDGTMTVRGALSLPAIGTATATQGTASDPLSFTASAFNGTTGAAQAQAFTWQAQPAGNNTAAPSASLNLLFAANGASAAETGLAIGANGLISFAPGQTFPGTGTGGGTITGVTAGTGLQGGGASGNVALNVDTTVVPQLNAANSFTGNQSINGNASINGSLTATGPITGASVSAGAGAFTQIGIGTVAPASALDVNGAATVRGALSLPAAGTATASQGANSDPITFTASAFNGTAGAAQNAAFTWQAEPVANGTSAASGSLNLLFAANGAGAAETGLAIGASGLISFAPGQTFPGTGTGSGTITGVTAGTGLKGGGASGNVTLNLDTTLVPQLNAANSFTANQSIAGNLTASGAVTAASVTTPLIDGVGAIFTGNIGMLISTSQNDGILSMGPYPFLHCYGGYTNTFLGALANGQLPPGPPFAENNTGIGFEALYNNGLGGGNTALGYMAGTANISGSGNTFLGAGANASLQGLVNATAVGAGAIVGENGAIALGTPGTRVGIGTSTPAEPLVIQADDNGSARGGPAAQLQIQGASNPAKQLILGYIADSGSDPGYGTIQAGEEYVMNTPLVLSPGGGGVGIGTTTVTRVLTVGAGLGHTIADGYDTYSSRRWKTNIRTLTGALEKVEQLRGVSYDLKANGKHEIGVIAEEVGAVVPELVSWEKNGKDAQGVDYTRLTALLIEAMKEQQRQIDRQEAELMKALAQIRELQGGPARPAQAASLPH